MAQNLIDLLERLLGSNEVLSRIGALIGLSPEKTKARSARPFRRSWQPSWVWRRSRRAGTGSPRWSRARTPVSSTMSPAPEWRSRGAFIDSGKGMLSSLFGQGELDGLAGAIGRSPAWTKLGGIVARRPGAGGHGRARSRAASPRPRCAGLGQDADSTRKTASPMPCRRAWPARSVRPGCSRASPIGWVRA